VILLPFLPVATKSQGDMATAETPCHIPINLFRNSAALSHEKTQGEDKSHWNILRSHIITVRTSGLASYRGGAAFIDSFACECV